MNITPNSRPHPGTPAQVQERGRALRHRFRVADIPHYTRWFTEYEPKWKGDASLMYRIQMIFNGRGAMTDVKLLEKCEALADKHLSAASYAA